MHKEQPEKRVDSHNTHEENNYQHYLEMGGIINEADYKNALDRAMGSVIPNKAHIKQVESITRFLEIELHNTENSFDPKIILYEILRSDVRPEGVKNHHDQMCDQQIFVEVLRMLGDLESVEKAIKAYPNISFKYQRDN